MPQQPAALELSATISDKTFPISSFTVNIPINVTHGEVTNYKVGDAYTPLITPKPPTQFGKEHRMAHPINVDIDEQWIRDRFANMLIDMAEELSPGIRLGRAGRRTGHVDGGCRLVSVCRDSIHDSQTQSKHSKQHSKPTPTRWGR